MGEDELDTLKQRAEFFGLDKTKDFEDFKNKYINAAKTLENTGNGGIIKAEKTEPKITDKLPTVPTVGVDPVTVYQAAKDGSRHGGVYRDALKKSKTRLQKSINSHEEQAAIEREAFMERFGENP